MRWGKFMHVILHIGAHRCATTTFQHYLRMNAARLMDRNIGFWGPRRTRAGLFRGILPTAAPSFGRNVQKRAAGRVQLRLSQAAENGVSHLLVSDENMMGSVRENLRLASLYCGIGERMARYRAAFGPHVSDVMINIRSLDTYWTSALGYGLTRGRGVPRPVALDRLAYSDRSWRDVITDVACAVPEARIWVLPFESYAGRPESQLQTVLPIAAPLAHARERLNATPHLPDLRALVSDGQAGQRPLATIRSRTHRPFTRALRGRSALALGRFGRSGPFAGPTTGQTGGATPAGFRFDERKTA